MRRARRGRGRRGGSARAGGRARVAASCRLPGEGERSGAGDGGESAGALCSGRAGPSRAEPRGACPAMPAVRQFASGLPRSVPLAGTPGLGWGRTLQNGGSGGEGGSWPCDLCVPEGCPHPDLSCLPSRHQRQPGVGLRAEPLEGGSWSRPKAIHDGQCGGCALAHLQQRITLETC